MAIFGLFKNKKKNTAQKAEPVKKEIEVAKATTDDKIDKPVKEEVKKPAALEKEETVKAETKNPTVATNKEPVQKTAPATAKTDAPTENKKAPAKKGEAATSVKKAQPKAEAKPEPKVEEVDTKADEIDAKAFEVPTATVATGYTGKFEINKSKDGKKFFFNLYASNKVGIATSQMYSSAQSALNGVNSVIANAEKAPIEDQSLKNYTAIPYPKWELYVDNGGKYRFRLCASNGSCVCHSQGYTTKAACKNGIDSIIRSSKNAEIDKTYITKKDEA